MVAGAILFFRIAKPLCLFRLPPESNALMVGGFLCVRQFSSAHLPGKDDGSVSRLQLNTIEDKVMVLDRKSRTEF
jgi:hypothetical protein